MLHLGMSKPEKMKKVVCSKLTRVEAIERKEEKDDGTSIE